MTRIKIANNKIGNINKQTKSGFSDYKEINDHEKTFMYNGFKFRIKKKENMSETSKPKIKINEKPVENEKKETQQTNKMDVSFKEIINSLPKGLDHDLKKMKKLGLNMFQVKSGLQNYQKQVIETFEGKDVIQDNFDSVMEQINTLSTKTLEYIIIEIVDTFYMKLNKFLKGLLRLFRKQDECAIQLKQISDTLQVLETSTISQIKNTPIINFYNFFKSHGEKIKQKDIDFLHGTVFEHQFMKAVEMKRNWDYLSDKSKKSIWMYIDELFELSKFFHIQTNNKKNIDVFKKMHYTDKQDIIGFINKAGKKADYRKVLLSNKLNL
jgi:hypothetical protein